MISSGRFLAAWACMNALASGLAAFACHSLRFTKYSPDGERMLMIGEAVSAGVLLGGGGALLLWMLRRRVPGWGLATAVALVLGRVMAGAAAQSGFRKGSAGSFDATAWFDPQVAVVWAVSEAVAISIFQATVLRPRFVLLWMAGLIAVWTAAAFARWPLQGLTDLQSWSGRFEVDAVWGLKAASQAVAVGLIQGAGTAWLLDRCVFKREAEEAPPA